MKKATLLLTLLLLLRTGLLPPLATADEPVVQAVLFWSENCAHCHEVIAETLPPLQERVDYPAIPGLLPPGGLTPQSGTPTPQPVAHVLFFYDRLCHECMVVQKEVLPPLQEKYGSQLVIDQRDVEGSTSNYNLLRALERQHGVAYWT
jgi:hypothetical protein